MTFPATPPPAIVFSSFKYPILNSSLVLYICQKWQRCISNTRSSRIFSRIFEIMAFLFWNDEVQVISRLGKEVQANEQAR